MSFKSTIIKAIKSLLKSSTETSTPTPDPGATDPTYNDAIPYDSITLFGSCRPNGAVPITGCVISDLKVRNGKLTFKYAKGGCEALGATSKDDSDYTQCFLGIYVNGTWKAAKFDWISTSRTSRGLEHCDEGYNGWPVEEYRKATDFIFFIVGVTKGKNNPTGKRSNVLYFKQ